MLKDEHTAADHSVHTDDHIQDLHRGETSKSNSFIANGTKLLGRISNAAAGRYVRGSGLGPLAGILERENMPDLLKDIATGVSLFNIAKTLLKRDPQSKSFIPLKDKFKFLINNAIQTELSGMAFRGADGSKAILNQTALSMALTLINNGPMGLITGAVQGNFGNPGGNENNGFSFGR